MRWWRATAIVVLVTALTAQAGFISIPHVWTPGETLTATQLNAFANAITAVVNGTLDTTNLKAAAAIKGTQLASSPNGISAGNINTGAVTSLGVQDGSLVSADLSPTAGILGSQLSATAAITGGQILDGSLTGGDIAGASEHHTTCLAGWSTTVGAVTSATGFVIGDVVRFINPDGTTASGTIGNIVGTTFTMSAPLGITPATLAIVTRDDGLAVTGLRLGAAVYSDSIQRDQTTSAVATTDVGGTLDCGTLPAARGRVDLRADVNGDVAFSTLASVATTITATIMQNGVSIVAQATTAASNGVVTLNGSCTAASNPFSCCTGSGTGTCGNLAGANNLQMPFHLGIEWTQPVDGSTHGYKLHIVATLPTGVVVQRRAVYLRCRQLA